MFAAMRRAIGDRTGNGVSIVSMLRPQISGLDEFRDHLV
jgi:hypothetical protein